MFDHTARLPTRTRLVQEGEKVWRVTQTLVDPEDHNDWAVEALIELDGWTPDLPLIRLVRIGA